MAIDNISISHLERSIYVATFHAAPSYGVYISQLIRYSRACGSYQDFLDRWLLLSRKLLKQGHIYVTNDHGYVPLVGNTSLSIPQSWLITEFLTRWTQFMCMFCISLFALLYFFFWSLCCLFFLDMRILITSLVSSNSYYL